MPCRILSKSDPSLLIPANFLGEIVSKSILVSSACFVGAFLLATAIVSPAQTFTTLASFDGTDGTQPVALVQGTDGNLYGTTAQGGVKSNCPQSSGCGTVFKITPAGALTSLYSFCTQTNCLDGETPVTGLVLGTDGNFYGTTNTGGGLTCGNFNFGCGTVFKITPQGVLTTLHTFVIAEGYGPSELLQASNGVFYGTLGGGASGYGTVFKMTSSGTVTTLYNFHKTDGADPTGALVQATNGNFYGTTVIGGADNCGTIFEITATGTLTSLHSFNNTDGCHPSARLVLATDGNLYGTTPGGGRERAGTVFKITPAGGFSTLYNFCSLDRCAGGADPGMLVQGSDGNFYGNSDLGGTSRAYGVAYSITPAGVATNLHLFTGGSDGAYPGRLIQNTNGILYGTTDAGGTTNYGVVFSLDMSLARFVEANPNSGRAGRIVTILGNNLTGATSVTFNGTAALFKVESDTDIRAKVPSGATTGTIEVTTPTGTLSSTFGFQVVP